MSRNEVTHKSHFFLHYVWKYPFAGVPKIGIYRKKFVLEYFLIKTVDLRFANSLEKTPAQVFSSQPK